MSYPMAPYPPSPGVQVNGTPTAAAAINFGSGLTSTLSGGVLTVSASGGGTLTLTITASTTLTAAQLVGYSQIICFCNAASGAITVTLPALATLDGAKQFLFIDSTGSATTHTTSLAITGGGTYALPGNAPGALPVSMFGSKIYEQISLTVPNSGSLVYLTEQ